MLVLRLNRPEARNALDYALMAALGRAFQEAEADPGIRCMVLTGTGDRAFCAGMDLRAFSEGAAPLAEDRSAVDRFTAFAQGTPCGVPLVGAAQATAVGGGFELLLGCDLVVASEDARFGLPEVRRGLLAGGVGTLIGSRLPLAQALELTMTGEPVDARRAYEMGLVNRVVPGPDVLEAAIGLAEAVVRNGPLAVEAARAVVRASSENLDRARDVQREWTARVFSSNDAREGAQAFVERRDPVWTGT